MEKELSIIIPAHNEGKTLAQNLPTINKTIRSMNLAYEIIVVNDGSTDNTLSVLEEEARNNPHLKILSSVHNRGKGYAVKAGMRESQGSMVGFLDADMAINPHYFAPFIEEIRRGADMVIASRYVPGADVSKVVSLRKIISRLFEFSRFLILGIPRIHDTLCGFKLFRKEKADELIGASILHGFCFDAEMLYIASKRNYTIKEFPVTIQKTFKSSINFLKDPFIMFFELIKIRTNDFLGKYSI